MRRRVRAGVIGLGVGERHILGYQAHPDCEVVAICDIDPDKLAEVAARHPGPRPLLDPAELLGDPTIDAVSICSYDDAHHGQIVAALEAGKHVFVEKPVCLLRSELDDIHARLAARPDLRFSSNLILRRAPRFVELRAMIAAGALGRVYQIEGDYNYGRLRKITEGWRGRLPDYSVTLGGGVHLIDLMMWLTGARVAEVAAFGARIATEGAGLPFDDTVTAALRFENGAIGKVSANFGCVYPHFHRLSVYGTEATFENDIGGGRLFTSRDPAEAPRVIDSPYPGAQKGDMLAAFVDAILGGRDEPEVPVVDVFAAMSVCLAIGDALHAGATRSVRYPEFASPPFHQRP